MKDSYKPGDIVVCILKHEIGIVKRVCKDWCFVWYGVGGTAARSPFDALSEPMSEEMIGNMFVLSDLMLLSYTNRMAFLSLMERRRRLLEGGDTSCLIDINFDGSLVVNEGVNK